MIIRIVKMTFQPELVPQFEALFEETKKQIRNFPGCNHLQLLRDVNHPHIFFTYSHWNSTKDLNNYRESALFADVWPRTKKLFGGKPEAWSTEQKHILE